ncbi:MAG TPA: hypothetical protein VEZ59_12480, partial [Sphingopyxis sp.]|nr:hypothetical protein [Sphingopyxis sp.]
VAANQERAALIAQPGVPIVRSGGESAGASPSAATGRSAHSIINCCLELQTHKRPRALLGTF